MFNEAAFSNYRDVHDGAADSKGEADVLTRAANCFKINLFRQSLDKPNADTGSDGLGVIRPYVTDRDVLIGTSCSGRWSSVALVHLIEVAHDVLNKRYRSSFFESATEEEIEIPDTAGELGRIAHGGARDCVSIARPQRPHSITSMHRQLEERLCCFAVPIGVDRKRRRMQLLSLC